MLEPVGPVQFAATGGYCGSGADPAPRVANRRHD